MMIIEWLVPLVGTGEESRKRQSFFFRTNNVSFREDEVRQQLRYDSYAFGIAYGYTLMKTCNIVF